MRGILNTLFEWKRIFIELCHLYEFHSYCCWGGTRHKVEETELKILAVGKGHPFLRFFASILYPYFGFPH